MINLAGCGITVRAAKGDPAVAATVVEMTKNGGAFTEKSVILDRPFVYMLIDTETNIPFFIGTMMNPAK